MYSETVKKNIHYYFVTCVVTVVFCINELISAFSENSWIATHDMLAIGSLSLQ